MKLVVISDTHNKHKQIDLPEGDVLIHCGDFTGMGRTHEVLNFLKWWVSRPHKYKILVAGNHDLGFENNKLIITQLLSDYYLNSNNHYLEHSSVVIDDKLFFGSPYTPEFLNWAFMYDRGSEKAKQLWSLVPSNTDVLITHGPLENILDKCNSFHPKYPENAGCGVLRNVVETKLKQLQYHLCGHIHEGHGMDYHKIEPVVCVNASICNEKYEPKNKAVELELK
jgi:predicted phosphodiesterase